MKALTAVQQEVFDLIRDHISQTGMPPTRAESRSVWGSVPQTRLKNI